MEKSIHLSVNNSIYKKLMEVLSNFSPKELKITEISNEYTATKAYLENELHEINAGNSNFHSIEEANAKWEETIRKYENRT